MTSIVFKIFASIFISIVFSLPAYVAASDSSLVPLGQTGELPEPQTCKAILGIGLGPGQQAVRNASRELKAKLVKNWLPYLSNLSNFNMSRSLRAFDILSVIYMDRPNGREELVDLVRESIHQLFKRSPLRQTENLLTDASEPQKPLELPKAAPSELLGRDTSFIDRYRLMEYAIVSWRVFDEILPPDYSTRGHFSANFDRNFSPYQMPEMYQIADELGLYEEAGVILKLLLTQNEYASLTTIAEKMNDDEFIFRLGLYSLSKFYFDRAHTFYYNKLWDSIETLKRVRAPQVRSKVRTLMIDLSEDIASTQFYGKIKKLYPGDTEKASSHMQVLLENTLRGLRSSGDIIKIIKEDSVKMDFITISDDPELRQAVRNVIEFSHEMKLELRPTDIIEALQTTNDQEALIDIANKNLNKGGNSTASTAFLAAGYVNKAIDLFLIEAEEIDDTFVKFHFASFFETALRGQLLDEVESALREKSEQLVALFHTEKDTVDNLRSLPLTPETTRRNTVDADFEQRAILLEGVGPDELASNYESSFQVAQGHEEGGDNLNAGGSYLIATFIDELLRNLNEK